jgi:hypothetical protein
MITYMTSREKNAINFIVIFGEYSEIISIDKYEKCTATDAVHDSLYEATEIFGDTNKTRSPGKNSLPTFL